MVGAGDGPELFGFARGGVESLAFRGGHARVGIALDEKEGPRGDAGDVANGRVIVGVEAEPAPDKEERERREGARDSIEELGIADERLVIGRKRALRDDRPDLGPVGGRRDRNSPPPWRGPRHRSSGFERSFWRPGS